METPNEVDEYLARIRKTVAESEALIAEAKLRIAETDRLLASQGLTRQQVLEMEFTKEQRLAVNEQLQLMGLPPIEDDETAFDFDAATEAVRAGTLETACDETCDPETRQRKFENFMQVYRL